MDVDQRWASRELCELTDEPAGGKRDDQSVFSGGGRLRDFQSAGEDHGHAVAAFANADDDVAGGERTRFSEPADAVDFGILEDRKSLLAAAVDHGILYCQHTRVPISSVIS